MIPRSAWQRIRRGHGAKGSRHYDWAVLAVTSDDAPGGHGGRDAGRSALLVRHHRYTGTCSFYRCWTPGPVQLARLIATAVARWRIGIVIPPPRRDHATASTGHNGDAATSTGPAKPTWRWNAYADTTP